MSRRIFRVFYQLYCLALGVFRTAKSPYRLLVACPNDFHFFHLRPLIEKLAADPAFKIQLIAFEGAHIDPVEGVEIVHKKDLKKHILKPVDMFLTTEFIDPPSWFATTKLVFFLHGIGPKVSYFASPKLAKFDVILAPSPFVADHQRPFLKPGAQIVSTGLPALDVFVRDDKATVEPSHEKKGRPVLLYAPSWSADPEQISADRAIIQAIIAQDVCDCIIRPHPLLMSSGRQGNPKIKQLLDEAEATNPAIRIHSGPGTSIYDVLPQADILMSDISSVLYEFLIFDRPILLYLKDGVAGFYDAEDIIEKTRRASFEVSDPGSFHDALMKSIAQPTAHALERCQLLDVMLYNPGNATTAIVSLIEKYAERK
ncbi:CDP-glycerol glycerophosphotransferase family protein [Octadecabacter sp. 1_MG-2023]|uniref:CDP-glycerol glycerophosphotransferase family protein n=1 Tax=unclassified Octadecabacter TaxID=196158 RepID=UPI001C081A63|nr:MULTISPECIES: CDP-glycerol glycerophosphotransferase family protein [unclassified Octadecabacter]MBU2994071.1 CDP-glycerol glycerophosphotransferase family protein [Octadecabacter sp. B2R22]MDO6736075.1 CDP-glycerol glycerophosphotransferase family protein [Octadecabacter sp. 1_MG-2023]